MKLRLALALLAAPQVLAAPLAARAQQATPAETAPHTFTFRGAPDVKSVHVAGAFNNWNNSAMPLQRQADGSWAATVTLPFGKHAYKFFVDGTNWITDPNAARNEDDGSGNTNSILLLLPPDYARLASPDDGVTATSALRHETAFPLLNYDRGQLILTLRARPGDIKSARAIVNGRAFPMALASSDELYALYTARAPWDRKRDLSYRFEIADGNARKYFGASSGRPFTLGARDYKPFEVPAWVERSVFYQIFPDRFANGDKSNDPTDAAPWNAKPQWFNRFGGDVAGVRAHIGHFSDLGISAVYFNPVFASPSNHRYDATDFKRIDSQFGTNEEFGSLSRNLQKRGIRTVMDFVFNHSATDFAPFADLRKSGEASAFKSWYFPKSFPIRVEDKPNYEAWNGYPSMPKLNVLNPPTRDYLLGLVDFWHKNAALSGLRLDVANEVDPRFWQQLRTRVKSVNRDAWIVGEVWGDGSPWLRGDQWDSVMNYQFRFAALDFFAKNSTKPSQFLDRLMAVHTRYGPQVSRNMMNLLSSHDTPRFLTDCGNDARKHRLAAAMQFTWIGAPSIYYGEELGMEGGGDPDNRRGMEWSRATPQNEMLRHYKKLIRIRNGSRALQSGEPQVLVADDAAGTLAFARVLENDAALVALNRSEEARSVKIAVPASMRRAAWSEALLGRRVAGGASVSVKLEPMSAAILLPAR